jgi:hypothetical protein
VQTRPFIERCPHSASSSGLGALVVTTVAFAGRTAGAAGLEAAVDPVDPVDLALYLASRIARCAASLLIARSPDEP